MNSFWCRYQLWTRPNAHLYKLRKCHMKRKTTYMSKKKWWVYVYTHAIHIRTSFGDGNQQNKYIFIQYIFNVDNKLAITQPYTHMHARIHTHTYHLTHRWRVEAHSRIEWKIEHTEWIEHCKPEWIVANKQKRHFSKFNIDDSKVSVETQEKKHTYTTHGECVYIELRSIEQT